MWTRIDRRRERTQRRRAIVASLLVASLSLGILLLLGLVELPRALRRDVAAGPELTLAARADGARALDGSVALHTPWALRTNGAELRVYRNSLELVTRCPSGPGCQADPEGGWILVWVLDRPGEYHAVSAQALGASGADLKAVVESARGAHNEVRLSPGLTVY